MTESLQSARLVEHYLKKDSGTILETSNIKLIRSALNSRSIFGL